jgi:hypothetical protein
MEPEVLLPRPQPTSCSYTEERESSIWPLSWTRWVNALCPSHRLFVDLLTLKMKAQWSLETSISIIGVTWREGEKANGAPILVYRTIVFFVAELKMGNKGTGVRVEGSGVCILTLILLTWKIRWAPNNASKQQMGFNSAFKGLRSGSNHVFLESFVNDSSK